MKGNRMSEEVAQVKSVSQLKAGSRLVGITLEADGKSLMTRAVEAVTRLSRDTAGTMYPVSTPRFKDANTVLYTIGDCLCSLATSSKFEHLSITVGFTAIISGIDPMLPEEEAVKHLEYMASALGYRLDHK
jgi:hypothetical protein